MFIGHYGVSFATKRFTPRTSLGVLFLVCLPAAYALPAPAGQYFSVGAGGLGGAFILQGLAVSHALAASTTIFPRACTSLRVFLST